MDKQALAMLIPIVAMAIPVVAIIFNGLQRVARLRLEETRIRAGSGSTAGEVASLREDLGEIRRELAEVQERLDFAERLLTQVRDADRLPGHRS